MRVLVAFDKFKDSISARKACDVAEGTMRRVDVTGPRGSQVTASFGIVPMDRIPDRARAMLGAAAARPEGTVAVVEMASASGLALLAPDMRDVMQASSVGTGQL